MQLLHILKNIRIFALRGGFALRCRGRLLDIELYWTLRCGGRAIARPRMTRRGRLTSVGYFGPSDWPAPESRI